MKTKRSWLRLAAILMTFGLVAAACGDDEPDFEAGALGAVEVADGEAIQIRSLNAISGDVAFLGIPNQRAVEMAIADYGEIKGHSVELGTGLDDLCSARNPTMPPRGCRSAPKPIEGLSVPTAARARSRTTPGLRA